MLDFSEQWDKEKIHNFVRSQPGESSLDRNIMAYAELKNTLHELLWMYSFKEKLQQQANVIECMDIISRVIADLIVDERFTIRNDRLVLDNP